MIKRPQPQEIIAELEATQSRNEKEAIIERAMRNHLPIDEFFAGVKMCLDPLFTFGVKQVPEKTEEGGQGLAWSDFEYLCSQLNRRKLTGHAARDAIQLQMDVATQDQWNGFYRRVLIKDLRCGVSEKTVNRVAKKLGIEKYTVPVFECMLARDSNNHPNLMKGPKQVEVKLDGVRVITVCKKGKVEMFSRNGRQLHNFPHIIEEIETVLAEKPAPYDCVLDGEVMSNSFQDLMKQIHRKDNVQSDDAVLHLFDFIPLEEFKHGDAQRPEVTLPVRDLAPEGYWWLVRSRSSKAPTCPFVFSLTNCHGAIKVEEGDGLTVDRRLAHPNVQGMDIEMHIPCLMH